MLLRIPLGLRKLQSYFFNPQCKLLSLLLPRHTNATRDNPRLQLCLLCEQLRTSVAVTRLISIYWSPSFLRGSYEDIVTRNRFSLRTTGLHNSLGF